MKVETPEEEVRGVDWSVLSEKEKSELIINQAIYIDLSRKFIRSLAVHGADIRNLILSMCIVLAMASFDVDNKNIIFSMIAAQLLFAFSSKVEESSTVLQLEEARKNYINLLQSKKKKDE
jgi:hypothetical protein